MAYYSREQLESMGFKFLGKNVKVSDKASIYDCGMIEIGDNSRIDDFCLISGRVSLGKNIHVTPMCLLAGGQPGIFIHDFCTLAYGVKVFSQSDDYSGETLTNSTVPRKYKQEKFAAVTFERHTIVGANSTIMPGVTLAEGTAVGAMTLVLRSTEPWFVYAGVPARKLRPRMRDLLRLEAEFLRESN